MEIHRHWLDEEFIKPMAARIILPYKSAHPIQTKRSVTNVQLLRPKRLGSSSKAQERGMNKVESLFKSNGYPAKLITKTKFAAKTYKHKNTDKLHKQPSNSSGKDATYISLLYIDNRLQENRLDSQTFKTSSAHCLEEWTHPKRKINHVSPGEPAMHI